LSAVTRARGAALRAPGTALAAASAAISRLAAASAPFLAIAALAGCGSGGKPTLTVSAAASLTNAFSAYARTFGGADLRVSFGGSDLLAAQIRQGVRPDVFASANMTLPDALHSAGLVQTPVAFAANRLVIAVPRGSQRVATLADLAKPGVTIAIGSPTVPVGAYTRTVLNHVPQAEAAAIARNIRSQEPDVTGVVGKLTQGAASAGFLYVTDVTATHGALRAIAIPAAFAPQVVYGVAVVKGTGHATQARAFIDGLLNGAGARALRAAGFAPPPR
jgi:molybdate transport system substrate-binding protein